MARMMDSDFASTKTANFGQYSKHFGEFKCEQTISSGFSNNRKRSYDDDDYVNIGFWDNLIMKEHEEQRE